MFVGSVIKEDTKELVKLAKKMKKNNVAVDFVNFGEETENTEKLEKFIEGVNSGDNSHLVTIPPGPHLLSNILTTSSIVNEDSAMGGVDGDVGASGAGGADLFEFGVDPSADPELALALRMSMEDEKARQEKEKQERQKKADEEVGSSSSAKPETISEEASKEPEQPSGSSKKDADGDDHMEL